MDFPGQMGGQVGSATLMLSAGCTALIGFAPAPALPARLQQRGPDGWERS